MTFLVIALCKVMSFLAVVSISHPPTSFLLVTLLKNNNDVTRKMKMTLRRGSTFISGVSYPLHNTYGIGRG